MPQSRETNFDDCGADIGGPIRYSTSSGVGLGQLDREQIGERIRALCREAVARCACLRGRTLDRLCVDVGENFLGMIPEHTAAGKPVQFLPLFDHSGSRASRPMIGLIGPPQEVT